MSQFIHILWLVFSERGFLRGTAWLILRFAKKLRFGFRQKHPNNKNPLPVEVVYVAAEKDLATLGPSIESLSKLTAVQVSDIVIIGKSGTGIESYANTNGLRFVDEKTLLGFGLERYPYPSETGSRSGWLYQQMLKLAWSDQAQETAYIVVDADTIFVNEVAFIEDGKYCFFFAEEWHEPYSRAFKFLFRKTDWSLWSYVAHMMIFDVAAVKAMRQSLETIHGQSWHAAIAQTRTIDNHSCFSEYHSYAVWFKSQFPEKFRQRLLYNKGVASDISTRTSDLGSFSKDCLTISLHSHIGKV